jgi:thiol-disulfide isomerase/thioredoxin
MRSKKSKLLPLLIAPLAALLLVAVSPSPAPSLDAPKPGPNYDITIRIKGLADTNVILAYYYGDKQYVKDTFPVNAKGELRITGSDTLGGGVYMLVFPDKNYFEFIVAEPVFTLETEKGNMVKAMKVKGSPENTYFFEYLRFIEDRKRDAEFWQTVRARSSADSLALANDKLAALDKEVIAFKKQFVESHKGTFVAKLLAAGDSPAIEEAPAEVTDSTARANYRFYHYKAKFFDNIDFSDDRMLRTPVFHSKLKEYTEKLTAQDPDSLIKSAKEIMDRAEKNKEMFKYCCIWLTNTYAKSNIMCFDKVYWWMLDNYYAKDKVWWLDTAQVRKLDEQHVRKRYNLCGNPAVNLVMEDTAGTSRSLGQIKSEYTVVYFWDYDCGHCKKTTPKLVEWYKEYKAKGVTVYAVCTRDDKTKWMEYIHKNGMQDMINVIDVQHKTNFKVFYDVFSTPQIYLLDKNKVIKGKRFEVETLKEFVDKLEDMRKKGL